LVGLIPERVDSSTPAPYRAVAYLICHECQFEVDPFRKTQPVEYREGVGRVVVTTKLKHQTSCSVKYGLEASLKIDRNSDKYDVAVVEPRMHQRHHERTEAVVGDVPTQLAKLS